MKLTCVAGITLFITLLFSGTAFPAGLPLNDRNQPPLVQWALKKEKNTDDAKNITGIINTLDDIYSDIYLKLANGKKITVFIDPAHGKLEDGRWQGGDATRRLSCTNRPEEYYSIIMSRALYGVLKNNRFLEVKTTDDFQEVLDNRSESYKNITFETTVELAKKHNAFLIVSEHLNNVSIFHKANGIVNIPGIHVTRNFDGSKILRYILKPYEGFLTLYNRSDTTGFSRHYAQVLKKKLAAQGLRPNFWQQGAVGDDRFCYFVDFPISVIYETAFTSNPEEEMLLRDPRWVKKIVQSQYESILEGIQDHFGLDISGEKPLLKRKTPPEKLELLKISRIAVYYLKKGDTKKSLAVIAEMERKYGNSGYGGDLEYFRFIRENLPLIQKNINLGDRYKKMANQSQLKKDGRETARLRSLSQAYYKTARAYTYRPVFQGYNALITREIHEKPVVAQNRSGDRKIPKKPDIVENVTLHRNSPLTLPIILPIEERQSLKDAISNALLPDSKTLARLTEAIGNARTPVSVMKSGYSEKLKKSVTWRATEYVRMRFTKGIYIIRLNSKMEVVNVTATDSVSLDSARYQNQQYLNNSHFCQGSRAKEL